ncbi:MAG: hypothetical protein M3082_02860 [Candidatus Dormibacteraeota bacterium]|nr:hypothetical protein [Candidatus Dormibacteraeota bacterium]
MADEDDWKAPAAEVADQLEYLLIDGTSAPNLISAIVPAALDSEIDALHIGTLGLVLEPMATTLTELASREYRRRLVMVDPNIRPAMIGVDGSYRRRLDLLI